MRSSYGITRRRLLLAAWTLAVGVPSAALGDAGRSSSARRLACDVVALFHDPTSAAAVGRRYLATHPDEATPQRLLASLGLDQGPHRRPDALRRYLHRRARADCAAGCMSRIDGWLLSETDARRCALAALNRI